MDAVELLAFAQIYGKGPEDIGSLFRTPCVTEWAGVLVGRQPDPAFRDPPKEWARGSAAARP